MESNIEKARGRNIPVQHTYSGRVSKHRENIKTLRNPMSTISESAQLESSEAGTSKSTFGGDLACRTRQDCNFKVFNDTKRPPTPMVFLSSSSSTLEVSTEDMSSLRRAHSEDLQGLMLDTLALTEVQCVSPEVEKSKDFLNGVSMDVLTQNYTGDTMQYLLRMERKVAKASTITTSWRTCVINWIMNVNHISKISKGNPALLQYACCYLDICLSTENVTRERLQFIAVTCYWLACKFHGKTISAKEIVTSCYFGFSRDKLLTTEIYVLKKLEFTAQQVIPDNFIPFLCWWCDPDKADIIESAANYIYQCGVMVSKDLCEEYPSVVAIACVCNALILLGRKKLMGRFESSPIYIEASKKAKDLSKTSAQLRDCLRTVASIDYKYKVPILQYTASKHQYIAMIIIKEINSEEIMSLDKKE